MLLSMPNDESLTDDYVASILKRDAEKKGQSRLFASGLSSLLSGRNRPRGEAPKPNQRFLKNLVRDVDTHNAALKAKKENDAVRRMRGLESNRDMSPKREKRTEGRDGNPDRWKNVLGGFGGGRDTRKDKSSDGRHFETERHRRRRHRDRDPRSRSRSRSPRRYRDDDRERDDDRPCKRRRHYSSSSPDRSSHRESSHKHSSKQARSPAPALTRQRASSTSREHPSDSDSDPLASLIGPALPPKSTARGRGANKSSNIDFRFAASYDPKADVDMDPDEAEGDDWDMALEALRDRAKWRKSGAERLRAAGFTDAEVEKWEKGDARGGEEEKDVRDVKWRRKGEGREWDVGKVFECSAEETNTNMQSRGKGISQEALVLPTHLCSAFL